MKRLAWLSDIHLDFLGDREVEDFVESVDRCKSDAVLISGDIGTGTNVKRHLSRFDELLETPIYFVLGNHDFYGKSVRELRDEITVLAEKSKRLTYLSAGKTAMLTERTAIIGHDGWADGRFGDYAHSNVELNDYFLISDFQFGPGQPFRTKAERLHVLQAFAQEAAEYLMATLPLASDDSQKVIVLLHVPPFREACWYEGKTSDDDFLPHFSSKVIGDVLLSFMKLHPEKQMLVLCGHTHGGGEAKILDNLVVFTAEAEYGAPAIQRVIEIP